MVVKVKISFHELTEAYGNYRRVSRSPRNQNTLIRFHQFLGVSEDVEEEVYKLSLVSEEVAQKLKWLAGPNAKTLYKAWCIKHGNKK